VAGHAPAGTAAVVRTPAIVGEVGHCKGVLHAPMGRPGPAPAYNRAMLHSLQQMLAPAVMERLTLLVNHVLSGETVATQRLLRHAGKVVRVEASAWPRLLPPLPPLAWRVTPAGLLEWCGPQALDAAELHLGVQADNPALLAAQLLAGDRPHIDVTGDAQLAGDVDWLMQNLRWDLTADLERVLPSPLAAGLARLGTALAGGLRSALQGFSTLRQRWQSRSGG
jgi:ubiquinone biosynthesis protein UbiJ